MHADFFCFSKISDRLWQGRTLGHWGWRTHHGRVICDVAIWTECLAIWLEEKLDVYHWLRVFHSICIVLEPFASMGFLLFSYWPSYWLSWEYTGSLGQFWIIYSVPSLSHWLWCRPGIFRVTDPQPKKVSTEKIPSQHRYSPISFWNKYAVLTDGVHHRHNCSEHAMY